MPNITLRNDLPGIVGLFHFRPETARPLSELAEVLLRDANTLSRGERELIATFVSSRNQRKFCTSPHAAFAGAQLQAWQALRERYGDRDESRVDRGKLLARLVYTSTVLVSTFEIEAALDSTSAA